MSRQIAIVIVVLMAAWTLQEKSADLGAGDQTALVQHEPNPPMAVWRPRVPDSVGTSVVTFGAASGTTVCQISTTGTGTTCSAGTGTAIISGN